MAVEISRFIFGLAKCYCSYALVIVHNLMIDFWWLYMQNILKAIGDINFSQTKINPRKIIMYSRFIMHKMYTYPIALWNFVSSAASVGQHEW